jgi:myosin-6
MQLTQEEKQELKQQKIAEKEKKIVEKEQKKKDKEEEKKLRLEMKKSKKKDKKRSGELLDETIGFDELVDDDIGMNIEETVTTLRSVRERKPRKRLIEEENV